jgi:MarR family transcriptional regulator, organic hydroperoxide resistance regulator
VAAFLARFSDPVASLRHGTSPRALATHLGVVPSTLSAAISRLAGCGYIRNVAHSEDRRKRELWLTEMGAEAMRSTSVLDAGRICRLLKQLTPAERQAAVDGLSLLARAARAMKEEK